MDSLFLILLVLFVLLLAWSDVLVIRRILRKGYESSRKTAYILLVLLLPVIGMSIYFLLDRQGTH